jgi:folate-dependent phosphoribosylglycinamide formyltransferase PurN
VLADDTAAALAQRVLEQEWLVYPEFVGAFCSDRVRWRDDGVPYCVD